MSLWVSLLVCLTACLGLTAQPVEEVITAKEVPLLGGWSEISPDAAEVQAAARLAVNAYNARSRSKRLFKLVTIRAAQRQVTNRINFKICAILGKTGCLKSEDPALSSCPADGRQVRCDFHVTFDPRNNKYKLQDQQCNKVE
uniref:Si:busm1-57f23.1 n=2 Tax=Tetraodon nigroviridis TaxID=99883 RepID=H3CAA1_TETNG